MISSVIAKFDCAPDECLQLVRQLSMHPAIEVGELVNHQQLPVTIDASGNRETEEITRWISKLEGVALVDVVYVHFEEDDEHEVARKTDCD